MKATEIAAFLGEPLHGADLDVAGPASLANARPRSVVFAAEFSEQALRALNAQPALLALLGREFHGKVAVSHIVTGNPRLAFARVLGRFFAPPRLAGIAPSARVSARATLGANVRIGEYAVIEEGATIGDNTELRHHVVVGRGVSIGADCLVKSHAVIGEEGFGFDFDAARTPVRLPHVGGVRIGNRVEIGAGTCVCRGTVDDTVIADDVKIDDLVYIAHNVSIGQGTLVIGKAAVSGSVRIGRHCWIAPAAALIDNISVGDRAVVGIGAVVTKDVPAGAVVAGNPARQIGGAP